MRTDGLIESISIELVDRGQSFLQAAHAYHCDTYDGDTYDCHQCELCQAIQATQSALNQVYAVLGLPPLYPD